MKIESLEHSAQRMIELTLPSEPNTSALEMQEYLGIRFPEIPKIYRVNRFTEAVLRAKTDPTQRSLHALVTNIKESTPHAPVALDGRTIIFSGIKRYDRPYYRFHENMHAYHIQKDTGIMQIARVNLYDRLRDKSLSGKEWDGEEWMAAKVFAEGIGMSGAFFTAKRMAEHTSDPSFAFEAYHHIAECATYSEEEEISRQLKSLVGQQCDSLPSPPMKTAYTDMRMKQLTENVFPLVAVGRNETLENIRKRAQRIVNYLSDAQYTVGWSFVSQVITELESQCHFSLANAFDSLIANRPRTLKDLEDPVQYAQIIV